MGNFTKDNIGALSGEGVSAQCYNNNNNFFINAGNLYTDAARKVTTKHGFSITFVDNRFYVSIGDFENNKALCNGYYLVPDRQFFFRGQFDNGYKNATGESVLDGNTFSKKYKLENGNTTDLNEVPGFLRLLPLDLFSVPFDTELK